MRCCRFLLARRPWTVQAWRDAEASDDGRGNGMHGAAWFESIAREKAAADRSRGPRAPEESFYDFPAPAPFASMPPRKRRGRDSGSDSDSDGRARRKQGGKGARASRAGAGAGTGDGRSEAAPPKAATQEAALDDAAIDTIRMYHDDLWAAFATSPPEGACQ